jgi:hypothetical protein
MTRRNGVNDLLVESPDDCPVHVNDVLGGTLTNNELFQSFDGHSSSTNTSHGGEARIIPACNKTLIHEPSQLALAENCLDEVQPGEVPNLNLPQA